MFKNSPFPKWKRMICCVICRPPWPPSVQLSLLHTQETPLLNSQRPSAHCNRDWTGFRGISRHTSSHRNTPILADDNSTENKHTQSMNGGSCAHSLHQNRLGEGRKNIWYFISYAFHRPLENRWKPDWQWSSVYFPEKAISSLLVLYSLPKRRTGGREKEIREEIEGRELVRRPEFNVWEQGRPSGIIQKPQGLNLTTNRTSSQSCVSHTMLELY